MCKKFETWKTELARNELNSYWIILNIPTIVTL